ncbi:hypothetical protein A3A71_01215 [Candidatus Berkelbacteria bacterium RIFCSPLOWO2_01_FULL_50_28]|uniref:General secretion pathway GspH domain-containing protein n=1 Tax=Candidatus Berkelbacteria bacterium RIFCSPLOWO2_01_FULL_50_28 TaxID=1797471 RepID=A0A1F5EB66_9BACT|nr:MAG: hypothetical protein A3A71_01215 [Candidatus Berkelbacteria bacterium RIFCSPLOWO2_01_FULL_50_28]
MELVISMAILSIIGTIVTTEIVRSFRQNNELTAKSIVQSDLILATDRVSRVLRSTVLVVETTQTNLKIRGYPSSGAVAPSEINFYISAGALKYSVVPPTGQAPNYTYNQGDAVYHTPLKKITNSTSNPLFNYYDGDGNLLAFPVTVADVKVVEFRPSALDSGSVLTTPISVTTKLTLRNFKTNL